MDNNKVSEGDQSPPMDGGDPRLRDLLPELFVSPIVKRGGQVVAVWPCKPPD
jgi:hypothetical protein